MWLMGHGNQHRIVQLKMHLYVWLVRLRLKLCQCQWLKSSLLRRWSSLMWYLMTKLVSMEGEGSMSCLRVIQCW